MPPSALHTSFAVILHNHTSRIMRRYRYDVRGGISVPPEIINPPKGSLHKVSRNIGPKAKLVYHWNDEDGTYKVEINYNEKDGFNADLSGPDARRFKIKVNQTGAEHTHLERNDPHAGHPSKPTHSRSQSNGSSHDNKAGNRSSRSFGKNGVKFGKVLSDRFKGPETSKASGVAFLSVTVERTSEEDLRKLQAEDEDKLEGFPTVVEVE
ncbi:hypothetical protein TWF281_006806 [Arthrobotrys megalospora]